MACNCGAKKNQTSKTAIKRLRENKLNLYGEQGAGLFLVADPAAGPRQFQKILVHDLSCEDVHVRGTHALAFKWFPYAWKDKEALGALHGPCYNSACDDSDQCEEQGPGCMCYQGECY